MLAAVGSLADGLAEDDARARAERFGPDVVAVAEPERLFRAVVKELREPR